VSFGSGGMSSAFVSGRILMFRYAISALSACNAILP
jgi:hypothetical protein